MVEGLSHAASILTGGPIEPEAEKPEGLEQADDQEIDPLDADQSESDAVEDSEQQETEPMTPKVLAEKLGITPKELYSDLSIDVGEGKTLTLSELKDRGKELMAVDGARDKVEAHREKMENEYLRKNREIAFLANKYGNQLSPDDQKQLASAHSAYVARENAATLESIPDWQDRETMTHDFGLINDVLEEYGFSQSEKSAFVDHRYVKLARDFSRLKERLATAADAEVKRKANQPGKRGRKSAPKAKDPVSLYKSGELSANAAILAAISNGAT